MTGRELRQVAVTISLMPVTVDTEIRAPDDGWRYHPKHVERFTDINKLHIVAYCWIIIDTYYTMHGPLNIKNKRLFEMIVRVSSTCHIQYTSDSSICVFFYLIEQHSKFLLHTVQVLYMCTLCDSTNINTIMEFVPNCL